MYSIFETNYKKMFKVRLFNYSTTTSKKHQHQYKNILITFVTSGFNLIKLIFKKYSISV